MRSERLVRKRTRDEEIHGRAGTWNAVVIKQPSTPLYIREFCRLLTNGPGAMAAKSAANGAVGPSVQSVSVRVLVADDERVARNRLTRLLNEVGDAEIVAECANGASTIAAVRTLKPDVLFVDVDMPDGGGPELAVRDRDMDHGAALGELGDQTTNAVAKLSETTRQVG